MYLKNKGDVDAVYSCGFQYVVPAGEVAEIPDIQAIELMLRHPKVEEVKTKPKPKIQIEVDETPIATEKTATSEVKSKEVDDG